MSKRRADGGIKAAFARQEKQAAASRETEHWLPCEAPLLGVPVVADDYLQEVQHKYEEYAKQAKGVHKLVEQADHAARAAGAASLSAAGGARTPPSAAATGRQQQQQQAGAAGADTATPSSPSSNSGGGGGLRAPQHTRLLTWQNLAAYCVQQLGMWPGSGVALPAVQQEALLRIVANSHLHLDPSISCRAYQLLLRNLRDHPPSQLLLPEGAAGDEPCGLLCATDRQSGLCWDMGFTPCAGSGPPLLQQPTTPFELLQQLVRNAVACLGTSGGGSSGGGSGRSSISSSQQGAGASQGQALLLMYVLELLQADLQARLAAFEQHRRLAGSLPTQAQRDEATQRAATVLRHSLLFRVMQDDGPGGDTWRYIPSQQKGKHQLVRDVLLLASAAAGAEETAADASPGSSTHGCMRATLVSAQQQLQDAGSSVDAACAAPVSAQDLVAGGQRLLLMLVQLFSGCEEAGVYGSGAHGRHHMQRSTAGPVQLNDRMELDDVLMQAIGVTSGHTASHRLPQLMYHDCLTRLLQLLPPPHRVRLLCFMAVECITARTVDPESDGKLASASYNQHMVMLKAYLSDKGKGHASFLQPQPLEVLRAVGVRLDWAARECFGGGPLFGLAMGALVSATQQLAQHQPTPPVTPDDAAAVRDVSTRILQRSLQQQQNNLASLVLDGHVDALLALTATLQQLAPPTAAA